MSYGDPPRIEYRSAKTGHLIVVPLEYQTRKGPRPRTERPSDPKRWYRCPCGLWWGKNKSTQCWCGKMRP